MKKGLLILSSNKYPDCKCFYDTQDHMGRINLYYSKVDKTWNKPGKLGYSLVDTGNGFVFTDHWNKKQFNLDYCQAQAIRALLKLEDNTGATFDFVERK